MGAVGGLLGLAGGAGGTGYSAPQVGQDVSESEQAARNVFNQQQAFSNALNPYALQGAASQAQLLGQLQQGAQGQGPNPALAQLAQTTGANTANQAALMAGQRGAGANPALIARQAAMQGAANQQGAAGQAATLAAQQQINQEQMLQAQQQAMVGQGQSALANTQNAANQIYSTGAGLQGNINQANAGLAGGMQGNQAKLIGGAMQGISSGAGLPVSSAEGGMIGMASGGVASVNYNPDPISSGNISVPDQGQGDSLYKGASSFGKFLAGGMNTDQSDASAKSGYAQADQVLGSSASNPQQMLPATGGPMDQQQYAKGGKVPVLLSPGEKVLSPEKAKKAAEGKANPMAEGKKVPGKPKVGGAKNDYANDTHKDALKPGSVVLPRSVTQSKDAEKKAVAFLQAIMAKHGGLK